MRFGNSKFVKMPKWIAYITVHNVSDFKVCSNLRVKDSCSLMTSEAAVLPALLAHSV